MRIKKDSSVVLIILVLVAVFLLLVGPVSNLGAEPTPQYGGVLRNAEREGPTRSIGIHWEVRAADSLAMRPAIESLFRQDRAGVIHPLLATGYKVAPDKSSVTIPLRKGVKFQDGSDFNADVALWNLQKKIEHRGRGTDRWASLEKIDDYTIRINLKGWDNFIVTGLTATGSAMMSKKTYDEKGEEWCMFHPVGTGPYIFESFQRDVVTKFKRNPNYWQKGLPYPDALELHYIKDSMTMVAALRAGEIDVLGADTGKMTADLREEGFKILSANQGTVVLLPDSKNPDSPFANKKVREAVSYAIDREAIVKARGFGFWDPSYQIIYDGNPGHIPNFQGRRYDPEKAKKLLAEAGYPKGFQTKVIPMAFGTDKDVWVAVQAYLGAVGIQVDLENVPYSKYTEYREKGWNNGMLGQPLGIYPNANQTYDFYFSENVRRVQYPVMKRPDGFQDLLEKSTATTEPDPAMMQQLAKMFYDDATIIPIHTTGRAYVHQKNVYDTGHMTWGMWTDWTTEKAWKSK
ncbi:MAG: ABC transporter substrate-binding protein [Deltaproteobacteria bacterium]|nr:ABC transporter substrate-binding protein [Deltaproteobacteria bacterium]